MAALEVLKGEDVGITLPASRKPAENLKYHSGIEDSRVSYLLELGEKAIEAFRNQNVDPYLGEDFVDRIPDGIFLEFFFSTDSVLYQEKLWEEYYGFGWGPPSEKAKRLQMTGTGRHIADRKISYWRIDDMSDLEGIVLHQIVTRLLGTIMGF